MRFGFVVFGFLLWNCFGIDLISKYDDYDSSSSSRAPKWFGIGVVRFENKYCVGLDSLDGTCYTRRQCRDLNGTRSGLCAGTIGHCCIIQRTCGSVSSYNNTYFVNSNFPSTMILGGATCTFTIRKCNPDICQVRIDFLSLTLAPPNASGYCVYDMLRITGGASLVRPICGENSGQHIYLGFYNADDITIAISTSESYAISRAWYIKVAQIGCDCPTTAPDGCLMYYTGLTGTVKSFNYGRTTTTEMYSMLEVGNPPPLMLPGTREMADMNYGVCIRMAPGYCSIEWSPTSNGSFAVSGSTPGFDIQPNIMCNNDFVVIPNPMPVSSDITPDRFCGNLFPATVTTSSKPFVLTVVTDQREKHSEVDIKLNEIGNLGFSLNFKQIPCGGIYC